MSRLVHSLHVAIGYARVSRIIPTIPDPLPSPVKGGLLGIILPRIHIINLVSILDETLQAYIDEKHVRWPTATKQNLSTRIKVVAGDNPRLNAKRLHELRDLRNSIAHSTEAIGEGAVSWQKLEDTITIVVEAFRALELIRSTPEIGAFFEREPTFFPEQLGPSGERMRHKHRVGAKLNNKVLLEYTTEIPYFPPSVKNQAAQTNR